MFKERLKKVQRKLLLEQAERDACSSSLSKLADDLEKVRDTQDVLEKASKALQKLTELKKKETTSKLEQIISFGLQTIFEDSSYEFKIEDSIKRKQVVYDFKVYSDSHESSEGVSILDSRGGGIANIVSLLLRLVILCMIDKNAERFLVLDEPFSNLSENYHENLVSAVKQIVSKLGVQLLVVSHQKSLDSFGDVVYELRKVGGVTSAHVVRNDNELI